MFLHLEHPYTRFLQNMLVPVEFPVRKIKALPADVSLSPSRKPAEQNSAVLARVHFHVLLTSTDKGPPQQQRWASRPRQPAAKKLDCVLLQKPILNIRVLNGKDHELYSVGWGRRWTLAPKGQLHGFCLAQRFIRGFRALTLVTGVQGSVTSPHYVQMLWSQLHMLSWGSLVAREGLVLWCGVDVGAAGLVRCRNALFFLSRMQNLWLRKKGLVNQSHGMWGTAKDS